MGLSVPGCVAWHFWREILDHQSNVILDEFIVMPDHIHAIIGIEASEKEAVTDVACYVCTDATSEQNDDEAANIMSNISPKSGSISAIIRSYKSAVTKWCNANGHAHFAWQSRFYDHIIRNEKALHRIRKYIQDNPLQWQLDMDADEVHEKGVKYMTESEP